MSKKSPQLRFEGFTDDWEERKLGEITTSYSGGTPSAGNSSYYKGDIPFIRSGEINSSKTELFLTEEGFNNSSAKLVEVGDILYALYGATSGEVGISQINGAINQAILAIKPIEGYESQFIMQWLKLQKQKIIGKYLQGGQGNLSGTIVKDLFLRIPDSKEQKKIGQFFKQLDDTIALHQRKLDLLKEQKKGYLQKMFPKNGAKVPELRFAGFADDWEERKLIEVADYRNGKAHEKDISEAGDYIVVNSKFVSTNGLVKKYSDEMIAPLSKNEIAFVLSDVPNGRAIARTFLISEENKYSLNQRIAGITPHADTNSYFLHSLMNRNHYFLRFDDGVSQTNLSKREVEKWVELYPSYGEQQKIGSFFKQLDDTITLHQRKLDLLKEQKKGFLQKMFV